MLERPLDEISAFAGLAVPAAPSGLPGIMVRERIGLGLATLTARQGKAGDVAARLKELHGVDLRMGSKVSQTDDLSLVGIGPGQWLALREGGGWRFSRDLAAEMDGIAAVTDQSSGYGVLRLSGPKARDVLAKGVPIDLHPDAFSPGDAAVTLASHVGIVLWQVDEAPTYDIAVFRSYAGSFWHWLAASAAEFGLAVSPPR